tara:strand:+ start:745 stop:1047 length:303 start_codon:yes stop_codon:yes gene_type:complete
MSEIQAVLFKTPKGWTATKARAWLKKEKMKPIKKVDKSGILLRYRLREPDYKFYVTKSQKNGINFVIGSNKKFKTKKMNKKRQKKVKKAPPAGIKVSLST